MSVGSRWTGSVIRCLGQYIGPAPQFGATLLPSAKDVVCYQLANAGKGPMYFTSEKLSDSANSMELARLLFSAAAKVAFSLPKGVRWWGACSDP